MKNKKRLQIYVVGIVLSIAILAVLYFLFFEITTIDAEVKNTRNLIEFAKKNLDANSKQSKEYAQQALDLSLQLNRKELELESRMMLGKSYVRLAYFDEAYSELNRAMAISVILKDSKYTAEIHHDMGGIEFYRGNFNLCMEHYQKSFELYRELNDEKEEANVMLSISNLNFNTGNFSEALDKQLLSIELYAKMNDKKGLASSYISISNTLSEIGKLDEAFDYLQKAKELLIELNLESYLGVIYNNFGEIEKERNNLDLALDYYKQALEIEKKTGNSEGIGEAYNNIGEIYLKQKQYDKAYNYFNEAIKVFTNSNMKMSLANAQINLAELYSKTNQMKQAEHLLLTVLTDIKKNKTLEIKAYRIITNIYTQNKNFEKALFFTQKLNSSQDSLQEHIYGNKMAQMEVTFNIRAESEILEDEKFKRNIFMIGVGVILFIVLSFSFVLLRKNYQINSANVKLAEQNQEILDAEEELQQANHELAKNVDRLKLIIQNIPVLINAVDEKGIFIFWNKECEIVTGFKEEEIILNPNALQLLYKNPEIVEKMRGGYHRHDDYRDISTRVHCKNGEEKIISWSNVSGSVPIPGWLEWNIGIDITERFLFETSLIKEKSLLNSLINSIPDLIFYKNTDGVYLGCNPAFSKFYSVENKEIIGKTDNEIFEPLLAQFFLESDKEILQLQSSKKYEKWVEQTNAEPLMLETIKTPFFDNAGNIIGIVGVSRDMTQRFKVQEQLKRAKEKAENADRLKSAFLSNMSHEIRTPMNAIVGFSNLLSAPNLSQNETNEYIRYINNSSNNLLTLIDDIIDTAKIEAGEIKIQKANTNINQILNELFKTYNELRLKRDKSSIDIVLKYENKTDFEISTDPNRFRQIVSNLINNALKFTDEGFIEFGYTICKITDSNKHKISVDAAHNQAFLQFYVKDTGIGIRAEKIGEIFNRFGQVHQINNRNVGGTGLGLTISKSLVELLGGSIWVESQPEKGSTFYFSIPYQPPVIEEVKKETSAPTAEQTDNAATKLMPNWSGKTILIAEDEMMNIRLIEIALRPTKVRVIHAKDGQIAVNMFYEHQQTGIDLVLMDIQMPNKNGYEAMKEIREINSRIPVIAQTAFALADEKQTTIEAGFNGYISKPINKDELFSILKQYLG